MLTSIHFKIVMFRVSHVLSTYIARIKKEFGRHAAAKLVVLDETHIRIGTRKIHTLLALGRQPFVVVDDTDAGLLRVI